MNCTLDTAIKEIDRQLQLLTRTDSRELHLRAYETASRIGVPEPYVWQALARVAGSGQIRLATWCERLWREVTFQEWPTPAFFNNPDDRNYVRLRPVGSREANGQSSVTAISPGHAIPDQQRCRFVPPHVVAPAPVSRETPPS